MHFSGAKLAVLLAWGLAGEGAGGRRGLRDGEARDAGRGLAELSEAGEHRGVAAEGVGGGAGGGLERKRHPRCGGCIEPEGGMSEAEESERKRKKKRSKGGSKEANSRALGSVKAAAARSNAATARLNANSFIDCNSKSRVSILLTPVAEGGRGWGRGVGTPRRSGRANIYTCICVCMYVRRCVRVCVARSAFRREADLIPRRRVTGITLL